STRFVSALCLSFRRRALWTLSARLRRTARRATRRRQGLQRAARTRDGTHHRRAIAKRPHDLGRFLLRLYRIQIAALASSARSALGRLAPLVAVRSSTRSRLSACGTAASVYAIDSANGRVAMAHSDATAHRQRTHLLQ